MGKIEDRLYFLLFLGTYHLFDSRRREGLQGLPGILQDTHNAMRPCSTQNGGIIVIVGDQIDACSFTRNKRYDEDVFVLGKLSFSLIDRN